MPEAPFTVRVAIDRVDQVVRAYKEFATIPEKVQRRLVLKVIPRSLKAEDPIFDDRPPKTVKYFRPRGNAPPRRASLCDVLEEDGASIVRRCQNQRSYRRRRNDARRNQLKTRAAVTRHLVDLYTKDKFSLKDLNECMDYKTADLRRVAVSAREYRPLVFANSKFAEISPRCSAERPLHAECISTFGYRAGGVRLRPGPREARPPVPHRQEGQVA